ncbi:MAG TPA: aminotransferase class I/II-fold pyridoxal phosphate-dependent enzyme [Chthoniobacterales bacterium]|nr:aminotransferase class I/II-fold pyridoxal phosphate-dependent enzyme [Chthoniobacterales bacterium]
MNEKPDPARLELSRDEMQRLGYRVVDLLVQHFGEIRNAPVGAKGQPADLLARFAGPPPEAPTEPNELLARLEKDVFPNNLHVDHPRFFAFVPGPGNFVSTMADALASGFNIFNGTWLGGSAAAAIELNVIDWFRRFCGFPETAGGLFVSGGSMANLTALHAARRAKLGDQIQNATIYFSDQTHYSVERALRVIGFAPEQFRKIPSDDRFRLPLDRLREMIRSDKEAGLRPFCIIANAGTTNTGAVDPLPELAELCATEKMWLHADGAYGAATMICERGREKLAGLDRVDSLSLDPHKWLFQPFECGCVLVRDAAQLKSAFQLMPEYMRDVHRHTEETNLADYGVQLSRGFRALKVWLSINTFGLAAFRDAVTSGFQLAEFAERELRSRRDCEILSPAEMGIVAFRFGKDDALQTRLVEQMLSDGFAFLTSTTLKGVTALRLCTINPRTTKDDIVQTIDRLEKFAL